MGGGGGGRRGGGGPGAGGGAGAGGAGDGEDHGLPPEHPAGGQRVEGDLHGGGEAARVGHALRGGNGDAVGLGEAVDEPGEESRGRVGHPVGPLPGRGVVEAEVPGEVHDPEVGVRVQRRPREPRPLPVGEGEDQRLDPLRDGGGVLVGDDEVRRPLEELVDIGEPSPRGPPRRGGGEREGGMPEEEARGLRPPVAARADDADGDARGARQPRSPSTMSARRWPSVRALAAGTLSSLWM